MRTRVLRLVLGLLVLALGLIEVQALLNVLRTQARVTERTVRGVREAVSRPARGLRRPSRPEGPTPGRWPPTTRSGCPWAAEVEVLDVTGGLRLARAAALARPSLAASRGAAGARARRRAGGEAAGREGGVARAQLPACSTSGDERWRCGCPRRAPEIVEDLGERRQLLLGHGLALVPWC